MFGGRLAPSDVKFCNFNITSHRIRTILADTHVLSSRVGTHPPALKSTVFDSKDTT